jgi:xylulokinase
MSLLGIDLGTTGCKAGVFGLDGSCMAQAYREYDMLHPQPGWAELDASEVWKKTMEVIAEVATQSAADPITALSVSSFAEAFVPVSKDRKLLGNSILCVDSRGQEHVDRLLETYSREAFYSINPNLLSPSYSLPKLLWLREHRTTIYEQADYFLLWADLVVFMLGGEAVASNSHANRTLLFDLDRNDWSGELLEWSGIPRDKLGRVVPGGTVVGIVADKMAVGLGLPAGVQLVAGGHDQCCNALGCGAVSAGKAVYGMGSFDCITPVYEKPSDPLAMLHCNLNIEHHVVPGLYVSFLYNQSGLLVKWFRDTFASVNVSYRQLDSEMPSDPTRLLVLPHFDVPPHHPGPASGVIVGLKTNTSRGEILKAILEGATLYFVEGMDSLRNMGLGSTQMIASGGGARSDAGLQIRADILGIPVVRPRITEAGLLGAAMLAGLSTGVFQSPEEAAGIFVHDDRVFEPDAKRHAFYLEKHASYRQLFPALEPILKTL